METEAYRNIMAIGMIDAHEALDKLSVPDRRAIFVALAAALLDLVDTPMPDDDWLAVQAVVAERGRCHERFRPILERGIVSACQGTAGAMVDCRDKRGMVAALTLLAVVVGASEQEFMELWQDGAIQHQATGAAVILELGTELVNGWLRCAASMAAS